LTSPDTDPTLPGLDLASPAIVERYVQGMRRLHDDWAALTPNQRVGRVKETLNAALTEAGVPAVQLSARPGLGTGGVFDFTQWIVRVGSETFQQPVLRSEQMSRLAGVAYHEAAHAQQWHDMARFHAGHGMTAAEITRATGIRQTQVLDAAIARPMEPPGQGSDARSRSAAEYHESVYGDGARHREQTLDDLPIHRMAVELAQNRYAGREAAFGPEHNLTVQARRDLRSAQSQLEQTHRAYRGLPEERDAWVLEEAVVKRAGAAPTPTSTQSWHPLQSTSEPARTQVAPESRPGKQIGQKPPPRPPRRPPTDATRRRPGSGR
jgi:hypothetical protein